jgi:putative membrane-bound dehydrogenase-like protein
MKFTLILSCLLLAASLAPGAPAIVLPHENARRIEVLFLGAPTSNGPGHDPIERYREVRKHLGTAGINFTYTESLDDLKREVLDRYDSLLLYGNWSNISPEQEKALLSYVEDGHGFVPIHCASACFGNSDAFIKLVGARFKSHGTDTFKTQIVAKTHPVMRDFDGFETWDETYVHDRHNEENRTLLQKREQEPWTWIRTQGKGRIFYTAYGHDLRTWTQEGFNELVRRGILWSVPDTIRAKWIALKLPKLETEKVELPGYRERKTITEAQKPLPPLESMKLAQVPQGMALSLFASEPDIVNPIAVAWDERGRAFVVETVDYPNNLQSANTGHDSIKICEDTNGDGRADKFTVFADKLSVPTSLVFANGGVICTNATDMLFLKDTNGDDKADVREVLFSGIKVNDTHAGVSSLRYGFDNWIYATIGYAGFDGKVGGKDVKFSSGLFRFKPDGSQIEFLQTTTNNTWGLGFTSDFDILGSTANGNPSWYFTFPSQDYSKVGLGAPKTPRADNDNPKVFPISMDVRQVDQFDKYTAGCGHTFVTSTRMPAEYRDRIAFVSEPTAKLTGSFEVTRKGTGYYAKLSPNNLFSSADSWSSPVYVDEGPDGAVWVCDWYNLIIQHNPTPRRDSAGFDARNGKGNAYESPLRDTKFGRIYRIYPQGTKDEVNPKLNPKVPATLVTALRHPNLNWRLAAQRLMIDNKATAAIPALKEFVAAGEPGSIQAVFTLDALGALDAETRRVAATSKSRGVRRAAILTAPADDTVLAQAFASDGAIRTSDTRELAELLVAFAKLKPTATNGKVVLNTLAVRSQELGQDSNLKDAWQIAARNQAAGVMAAAGTLRGQAGQVADLEGWLAPVASRATGQTLEAEKPVARKFPVNQTVHERGSQVFSHTCVACHGDDGKGVPGAFPPLDGSDWVTGDPSIPARIVAHGVQGPIEVSGQKFNSVMPGLSDLTDQEIADVLTFVRQNWSNDAAPVTADLVKKVRSVAHPAPWTADELKK